MLQEKVQTHELREVLSWVSDKYNVELTNFDVYGDDSEFKSFFSGKNYRENIPEALRGNNEELSLAYFNKKSESTQYIKENLLIITKGRKIELMLDTRGGGDISIEDEKVGRAILELRKKDNWGAGRDRKMTQIYSFQLDDPSLPQIRAFLEEVLE